VAGVADLGGSIITGIDGNPLAVLAAQLRIPLHHINSADVPLFCDDGSQADRTLDSKVVLSPWSRCRAKWRDRLERESD
jgi:lysine-specific histone demethylase 1